MNFQHMARYTGVRKGSQKLNVNVNHRKEIKNNNFLKNITLIIEKK